MATVIDALVVTLGLDAKGFQRGVNTAKDSLRKTGDETKKTAREMDAAGKQAAMFFSRVRNEALALLGVFTAGMGIKNFTANTINSAASLGRLASNLNMSTENLNAWQRAAERAGGSAEGITNQLKQSASEVAKFQRGMSAETLPAFFQFGGNVRDLKDGNTYLLARSRIVSEIYKTDRARAALAANMMGISDDQFDLIKQGPAAIQQLVSAQQKRSAISAKDAQDALKLRNLYLDLRDTFQSVGTKILVALIPAFERAIKAGQGLADAALENKDKIIAWVDSLVVGITEFAEGANEAAKAVGGWKNVLLALAGLKVLSIISPLLSLAGVLGRIGASLGVIGGASAAAGITALGTLAGSAALLTYSSALGVGEQEQLAAINNPANQSESVLNAMRFFEGKGYTREQAAGIVSNLMAESNLNPGAVGDNGKAIGIAQWHSVRQEDFRRQFGFDLKNATLAQQLEFVDWELKNTEWQAMQKLKASRTPQEAGAAVSRYYERPLKVEEEAEKRGVRAGAIFGAMEMAQIKSAAQSTAAINNRASPMAMNPGGSGLVTQMDQSSNVTITGPITVTTQATDGAGIARELGALGQSQSMVNVANTGIF